MVSLEFAYSVNKSKVSLHDYLEQISHSFRSTTEGFLFEIGKLCTLSFGIQYLHLSFSLLGNCYKLW
uniref:Uncharacterized protein n=1 Tax=Arundo donax TaxID=35708 RepID=A0A0A9T3N2_ARUDO